MALTLANGVTAVRDVLNEATASFWSDTQIENWIKEGTRTFASKSKLIQTLGDITLVADQLYYDVSDEAWIADLLKIHTAYYDDGSDNFKGILKVDPKQIGNVSAFTPGDPKYFCVFGRNVYVWPLSTAAMVTAGGTISCLYSKETEDFTEVPDEFQHLPIAYALGRAKQRDQKFQEAQAFFAQFNAEVEFESLDKNDREQDTLDNFKVKMAEPRR